MSVVRTSGLVTASVLLASHLGCSPTETGDPPFQLQVTQNYGFATLSWQAVDGADAYHIERMPLGDDADETQYSLTGVWLPDRYSPQLREGGELTFADSGFALGGHYRWRVRAITDDGVMSSNDTAASSVSIEIDAQTLGYSAPDSDLTGFELSRGVQWTSQADEAAWLTALADISPRMTLEQVGTTAQGRPLFLATLRDPDTTTSHAPAMINCTVHGGERAPREACLILIRELALSDETEVAQLLSEITVLVNPTVNPDGWAVASRTNSNGQDLNRDHVLLRHPETFAIAEVIRDHQPALIMDAHELGGGPDLHWLWSRSPNVAEPLWRIGQESLTRNHAFDLAAGSGWSPTIWRTHRLDGWETLLQNTAGLKNAVGQLQESPRIPGDIRPFEQEEGTPANQRRRVYSHLWGFRMHLDWYRDNVEMIAQAVEQANDLHTGNHGPVYLDGARDVPQPPPANEAPTRTFEQSYCGYLVTADQLEQRHGNEGEDGSTWQSATVAERLTAHGVIVEPLAGHWVRVPMAQGLRALLPYIFDPELETGTRPEGIPNLRMVAGIRLNDRADMVVLNGAATSVPNRVNSAGCSVNDLIMDEQFAADRAEFSVHLGATLDALVAAGDLTAEEQSLLLQSVSTQ